MPKSGGSSTITGVDFELWFVTLKFADAFFDDGMKVKPQAQTYINPSTQQTEITVIDDIHISFQSLKYEFYNLKFRAPNIKYWGINDLKEQKVLSQFSEQFLKSSIAELYFVTQSPCPIFHEILPRGKDCTKRSELEIVLKPNDYIGQWDKLKAELDFSDEQMMAFSKQVRYKPIIDIEEIKTLIRQKFEGHVTNVPFLPNCLYQLAIEAAKAGKTIVKNNIVSYLGKSDIHLKAHLKAEELLEKIYCASAGLEIVSDTFFNDCRINREEVDKLSNWIKNPLEKNKPPIAVLTGKAGCGKSVILKNLFKRLTDESIPVLGIKTDMLMMPSLLCLSQELDLADGIKEALASIVEKYGIAVILLDQMDALSQALSTDRRVLNTYFNLISQLSLICNLRIIISCRIYDLKYDPLLRSFEDKHIIEVKNLSEEQIGFVLSHLGIEKERVSKTLMQLLEVPLHLKVFAGIYKEGTNLSSLNTLQDLYEELWNQRILSAPNKKAVLDAIRTITNEMDKSKSLNVPFALLDQNDDGRRYLLSQSIMLSYKKKVQFFHQSFFDFCYARAFISLHDSLLNTILQQHQGIFVRSQIKQVLLYLRGSDQNRYINELREFLINKKIRFHIWLLVVNQLAFVEDPTDEELQVIKPLLDTDIDFTKHFVDGLRSEQWLISLINHHLLHIFLKSKDSTLSNLVVWKLAALINIFTNTIIDFLSNFPIIEKRDEYICKILARLDHWENENAVTLFMKRLDIFKTPSHQHSYYHILESIFLCRPDVVCKVFWDDLNKKLDNMVSPEDFEKRNFCSYHDIKLFKKIHDWDDEHAFIEGLKIIYRLVEITKWESNTPFYNDRAFYGFEKFEHDLYEHWKLFKIVQEKWKSVAQNDKPTFLKLATDLQESNSITLLKLLTLGYLSNHTAYLEEGFRLLTRQGILEEVVTSSSEGYELRCLLNNMDQFFSLEQKEIINKLILSLAVPEWEKPRCRGRGSLIGYSRYLILSAIPKDEIKKFSDLEKQFYELGRKYGNHQDTPLERVKCGFVEPPLPEDAYENMTKEQWIASFKKYDESTGWDQPRENFFKGGMVEHSRAFGEKVFKRPDEFYDFVFTLGKRNDISISYLTAGIDGLVRAKYDLEKIKTLIKEYWKDKNTEFRKIIIKALAYINREDTLDLNLILILEEYALNDPDPMEEEWSIDAGNGIPYYRGDPFAHGINTVRGSATEILAIHGYKTAYSNKLFDIMEKIVNDPSISVRCCLIRFLQGMLKWDREKVYNIFMKLAEDQHPKIIKYGLECLNYLMTKDNFHNFKLHLKVAMVLDEKYGHIHVGKYVGQVLMLAYVRGYSESEDLLEEGFKVSDNIKIGAINFSSRHLLSGNKEVSDKSRDIYLKFLGEDSKKISNEYGWGFNELKPESFNELYDLIEAYSRSIHVFREPSYFLKYLMRCLIFDPKKCVDLIQNSVVREGTFSQPSPLIIEEGPVQALICSYNKLLDPEYQEKAMDIFDRILKEEDYKSEGLKVLAEQDRG